MHLDHEHDRRDYGSDVRFLVRAGDGNRTRTISLGIGAFRSSQCPELRGWLSVSDHEIAVFTGVNGTAILDRAGPDGSPTICFSGVAYPESGRGSSVLRCRLPLAALVAVSRSGRDEGRAGRAGSAQVPGVGSEENSGVSAHVIYLVGGAPRVGKSSLAQRLLAIDGIPWLPTDVIRTVVRRVAPDVDAIDQDPVDAVALAEVMYPHIEQAAEVCAEEASRFLIEGFELAPSYPMRLRAALGRTEIRACFLGHGSFSAGDLAGYRGPKPQSERELSPEALRESASWIRQRSRQLRHQCADLRVPYLDVGEAGFEAGLAEARALLLGRG